jgi:hypothetical protein
MSTVLLAPVPFNLSRIGHVKPRGPSVTADGAHGPTGSVSWSRDSPLASGVRGCLGDVRQG